MGRRAAACEFVIPRLAKNPNSLDFQTERLRVRHPAKCANGAQMASSALGHNAKILTASRRLPL
jgi:hypothetical protein